VPRALRGETSGGAEFVLRRKDTGETWVGNYSYAPIRNPEGAIVGSVVAARDITERKQNEAELERYRDQLEQLIEERTLELSAARNEAERLTAVKSAFLANMSHEIRSPLNAVLGICYLLEQRQLDNEARQLLSKMHGAGNSLLALINDILDFSKIEAGRIEIEHAPFKLMDVLEQLASLMSVVASDKDLELIINPPILMLDKLMGDSLRLQQVLTNLVSNAIKFTDRGEVELSIRTERKSDRQISLRFTVRDTGIGISPEQQRDIFSAFSQADATITRRFGGSGLGLCISRQLVKLMGGDLQVKSQLGLGSEFWFELTFQKDLRADRTPSYLSRLRLLVADDSATCREALVNTAASLGWIADVVNSGATALHRMAVRLDAQKPYDVVILDWKMPEMDGLATAILIQETLKIKYARFKKPPIVIMVTAHAREDILQSPGIDQVDAVLSKPVTPSSLYNTITDIIEKRDCIKLFDTGSALPLSTKYLPGIRILVVDDSDINREVAQRILEAQGALVSLAVDGRDALQRLTAAPDSFDIVLMDVQMPGMDGYSASRLIRDNPRWSGLPIIALTAGAFESFRNAAFEAGMNDFVSKPFSVEELLSIIRRYTGNPPPVGQHPDNNMERLGQSPGDRPDYPDETPLDLPGVDLGKGLSHWGEEKIYAKFLNKFANSYKNAGHEIAELLRLDDRVGAAALTHKLKGVAGNLALKDAEECLSRLEALVQAGTAAIESVEPLQKAIDEVCASIAIWTNAHAGAGDQLPPLTASADIPGEPRLILEQLLCALDQDDPDGAEPYISQLQGRIPAADFNLIREQLDEFAFRGAEETIRILIQRLNFD
jgi:signal transduction histidine kinase/DNA-binding response OmpR family regulator